MDSPSPESAPVEAPQSAPDEPPPWAPDEPPPPAPDESPPPPPDEPPPPESAPDEPPPPPPESAPDEPPPPPEEPPPPESAPDEPQPSPPDEAPQSAPKEPPGEPPTTSSPPARPLWSPFPHPPTPNEMPRKIGGQVKSEVVEIAVGAVIVGLIFIVLLGLCFCIMKKKRKLHVFLHLQSLLPKNDHSGNPPGYLRAAFTYEELKLATDDFSEANFLGEGAFGYVHKGVLSNGQVVAIKQLKAGSGQGERDFLAEFDIISRIHHRHLVSLVGYCMSGIQGLLVYEFVPNKTLEFHLHGKDRPVMNWPNRMKIALGSAKGLAYLHAGCLPKIIHRDIKAGNILITANMEAKVADFGLSKLSSDTQTHVSTRIAGTFGYLAPEYASSGKLTEKSDVFSFGVLLLELITGRRPFYKTNLLIDELLVDWARPLLTQALQDDNFDAFVDPKLQEYDLSEMTRMVACAAACIHRSARLRPQMSQTVRALEGPTTLEDLNEGVTSGHGSSEYSSSQYNEDIEKFKKLALQTLETDSSGFSAFTSDSGQNPSSSTSEDFYSIIISQHKM